MKIKFILALVFISSALYAQSCYSVGLMNISKKNAQELQNKFNFPKECIIANIGIFKSVRCGCLDTYKQAQTNLENNYGHYEGAYIVQTSRSRFNKLELKPKKLQYRKTITSKKRIKKNLFIPKNAIFDYVTIDQKTGKLVSYLKPKQRSYRKKRVIKKVDDLNARVRKILEVQNNKQKKIVKKPRRVLQKPKRVYVKKEISPKAHKQVIYKRQDSLEDKAIKAKLKKLTTQLKPVKNDTKVKELEIFEPRKIIPTKKTSKAPKKKYFHEEDEDISEILDFIDSEEDLNNDIIDKPTIDENDKEFFYDDFDQDNDIYLD